MGRTPSAAALLAVLAVSAASALAVAGVAHAQAPVALDADSPAAITAPGTIVVRFNDTVQATDGTFTGLRLTNGTVGDIPGNILTVKGDSSDPDTSDNRYIGKTLTLTFNSRHPVSPFVWGTFSITGGSSPHAIADGGGNPANIVGSVTAGTVTAAAAQAPSVVEDGARILDNETLEVVFSEPVTVRAGSFIGLEAGPNRNSLETINILGDPATTTDTLTLKFVGDIDDGDIIELRLPADIEDRDGNRLGHAAASGTGGTGDNAARGITNEGPDNPYDVTDTRKPTLDLLAFTSKSTITASFSTPVSVSSGDFGDAFSGFSIAVPFESRGVPMDSISVSSFDARTNNTDALKFRYTLSGTAGDGSVVKADRDDIPSDLTGTADINYDRLKGVYGFSFDATGTDSGVYIADGQPPVLDTAAVTGPKEVRLAFSEDVRADRDDFSNVRVDGAAKKIDRVTTSGKVVTMELESADDLATDATGTVDIADTLTDDAEDDDGTYAADIDNAFAGAKGQRLADLQPPTVTAKVTGPDTVTVRFSERVDATPAAFRALMIDGDGAGNDPASAVASNSTSLGDRTVATITFAPRLAAGEYDATGTVGIPGAVRDDAGNLMRNDTADFEGTDTLRILAGQRPDVTSAEITGPNQFTVTFTEPVDARTGHFTALVIDHNGDSFGDDDGALITDDPTATDDDAFANVLGLSGAGTDTIVLSFDGAAASSVAKGRVTVSDRLTDGDGAVLGLNKTNNGGLFADKAANQLRLDDGQAILVESAWITGPNEVTVAFSEPPTAGPGDFDSLRIAGEPSDRPITGAVPDGKNATVTFGGGAAPGNATARIDVLDTVEGRDGNGLGAPAAAYPVADRQPPEIVGSPAITGPNTVTVWFSEAVTAPKGSFALSGGQLEGRTVSTVTGSGTDTLLLGLSGASVPANATGTIAADDRVVDLAAAPNALADNAARDVADGQPPSIESAGITDSSEITVVFSEAVVADGDGADFGNLVLSGDDPRVVTDVEGSDTDTLVLTFNGTAPRGSTATVDVAGTISDTAGNALAAVAGLEVTADQVPKVQSAAITAPNTITVTFSEPVTAPKHAFNALVLSPGNARNVDTCAYGAAPGAPACGTRSAPSERIVLAFDGAPALPETTAVINIAASVADVDGNALDEQTAFPVAAGQVPTIHYAKFAADGTDTITLRVSEPVNATKPAFTGLTLYPGGTRNVETCRYSTAGDAAACGTPGASTYTIVLTFDGERAAQNVTATLGIAGMALYDSDDNAMLAVPSQFVAASQKPVLESAGLTAPNMITLAFSERVIAEPDDFDNLYIAGEAAGRTVTDVAGSGTDTVTLAFGGTPAPAWATAVIDVEGLTDTAMQEIAPLRSHAVADMQPPTVASAAITAPNAVTVVFSEAVAASVSNFTGLAMAAPGQPPAARAVVSLNNSTDTVTARTVVAAFDGPPVAAGSSGTVDVAGVADLAGNAMAAVNDLPLAAGDIGPGILGGTVFADANDNGMRDGGEPVIAGVTVIMADTADAARMFAQRTDTGGTYAFDQIGSGSVLVQVAPVPSGHVPATGTLSYAKATIEPASVTTVDFALYPVPPAQMATVAGKVYADRDADGAFDNGTDSGMPNVPVFAVDFLTLTQASANTTASGDYTITGVLPDALLVQAHPLPAGHTTHGDAKSYAYVTPDRGQTVTVDFPLSAVEPSGTGTIIIEVFGDADSNGVRDAGESGVEGAVVYTYELLTATTSVQTTPASGITTHPGLIPDVVLAQINAHVLPSGYTRITTDNAGFEYVTVEPGGTTTVSIGLS